MRLLAAHKTVAVEGGSMEEVRAAVLDGADHIHYKAAPNAGPRTPVTAQAWLDIQRLFATGDDVSLHSILTLRGSSAEAAARLLGIHPEQLPEDQHVTLIDQLYRVDAGREA
jgi:hypothetical protein